MYFVTSAHDDLAILKRLPFPATSAAARPKIAAGLR